MRILTMLATTAVVLAVVNSRANTLNHNDTITAIYGSGNPNVGWNSSTMSDGSVLALMADNRHTGAVPNNGDGSYSFPTGTDPSNPARALWNFAIDVSNGATLGSQPFAKYIVSIMGPGGVNSSFLMQSVPDNAYQTSSGVHTGTFATYGSGATVMQNSENLLFFPGGNANLPGDYNISLVENTPAGIVNEVDIVVHVGSVPDVGSSTAGLLALSLAPLGLIGAWLRRKKVTS